MSTGATTPKLLTADELVDRLRVFSPGIVADLYDVVVRGLQTEEDRETRFDRKAHTLMVASVIMVAAAAIVGVHIRPIVGSITWPVLSYVLMLLAGVASVVTSLRVVFVSGEYRGVDEHEVLNLEELQAADDEFLQAQKEEKEERGNVRAQGRYRRLLIAHWWQMWQQHFRVHEQKAIALRHAQTAFVVFVGLFAVTGIALATVPMHCA